MLVLTRRTDEAIVIRNSNGQEIRLVVVDVRGSKVRLGIEAPPEVRIARSEICFDQAFQESLDDSIEGVFARA